MKRFIHTFNLTIVLLGLIILQANAQDSTSVSFAELLNQKATEIPRLNEKINISVGNVPIQEFLRGVANNSGVNIDVDPTLNFVVSNNFTEVRVADILIFLKEQFALDISFIGNIIIIKSQKKNLPDVKTKRVVYDDQTGLITFDCNNENLDELVKEITLVTGINLVISPDITSKQIKGYIQNMPFDQAIKKLAYVNFLEVDKTDDQFYILKPVASSEKESKDKLKTGNYDKSKQIDVESFRRKGIQISADRADSISIYATNAAKIDLIEIVTNKLAIDYFIASKVEGEITLNVSGIDFDEFLNYVFSGTLLTYRNVNNVYVIGDTTNFSDYRIIQLNHRTVDSLERQLPSSLKKNINIKEFEELNSFFVSGPTNKIDEFEKFVRLIDKPVPVILIEIIIVDVTKSHIVATGLKAGLGKAPATTTGEIFPSVDMTLSSESINSILNKLDGFGWVNLGNVTPNFYATLKLLESEGILDIKSTPKLSTINGHKATLKIGQTKYYKEETNTYQGTLTTNQIQSYTYKSVDANLEIEIRPVVSGDNQITLEITVIQSDFDLTASLGEGAPPDIRNKEFRSTIRVKNEDVVLLGGLEQSQNNESGSGLPLITRIPILKWLFSSKTKNKSNAKLNVFIKPTIIG